MVLLQLYMAWQFFRRVFKFVGGKILGKLAPRLVFFQYSHMVNYELQQKKRRFGLYQIRTHSQFIMQQLRIKKMGESVGLSAVTDPFTQSPDQIHVLSGNHDAYYDISDTETVTSEYLDDLERSMQFVQLDRSMVQDI